MDRKFWRAFGLYAGGVIGVGVFGLPRSLVLAGTVPFVVLLAAVGVLAWWIQRSYLAIVLSTPGRHRLPGYARIHLGPVGGWVAAFANVLGLLGALVAYLIAGGTFLRLFLEPLVSLPQWAATGMYLLPGALLLLVGVRALPSLELVILFLFLLVQALLVPLAVGRWSAADLPALGELSGMLLPYGVLLFSFWGVSLIPETAELAGRAVRRAARVLAVGLLIAGLSYAAFAFLVAGLSGGGTTEDALEGLRTVLGDGVVWVSLLFGVLTTFSSYLALGLTLARTFTLDFRVPRVAAWAVTIGVPVLLLGIGVSSLLAVLSVSGAVFLGIEGMVVLAMRGRLASGPQAARLRAGLALPILLLALGVIVEIARTVLF